MKNLSYNVTLSPPEVDQYCELKTKETRQKLLNGQEDIVRAERRRRRTQVAARELKEKLDHLHNEMALLQKEITAKSRSFMEIEQESSWLENRMFKQKRKNIPLLIIELVQNGGWVSPDDTKGSADSDSDNL
jgi:septal ring factor EnvC (AmiA/AmiB activator)